ncbi:uncharacterized protein EV154DRAFT_573691 [Mucor mucedo]|uniref:uncharacterized protein n=1 Tax=Mucor mucedo TaxID=29922 RepID=UPI00221F6919|nr:uncharacterized protein EV154DRAFT_573691 [Mucor mucedo]KAI7887554.1 hypothetical protein EV154DRAFT_573691 [Mucor mucedo]
MTATCEIFITAVFPKMNEDRWIIECHNDVHNHDLLEDDKKLCLVKNRQLHYEQQRTIDEVHVANAKTSAIVAAVNNVKCTKTRESAKDITNQCALLRRALNKDENQRHMNPFIRNLEEKGSSLSSKYEEIGSERIEDGFHQLLCRFGMGTDETNMTYDRFFKTLKTKIVNFVDELYKQRASWVKQYSDKCCHMGIYTTNPVEPAHCALKENNCQIAKCALATTFGQLDMELAQQNFKVVMDKGYTTFSADPFVKTNSMFRELVNVVSRFAFEMIKKQILPYRHIIHMEEYDQVFSSQTNSNRFDNVVIRKDVVIPLSSVDAKWIVGKLALSNNSNPLESVHQLLSAAFEKDELVVSSQKIAKTAKILSQGEAVEAKVKKVNKRKPSTIKKLKQATFDDSTIIDENINPYISLLCVCMLQFMLTHVASVSNVLGEGNCGFRSLAASVGRDEVIRVALSLGDELLGDFKKDEGFYMDVRRCLLNN